MPRKRTEDYLDSENEFTDTGPVRQRGSVRVETSHSRTVVRRKTRTATANTPKVEGIHKRANKRINW